MKDIKPGDTVFYLGGKYPAQCVTAIELCFDVGRCTQCKGFRWWTTDIAPIKPYRAVRVCECLLVPLDGYEPTAEDKEERHIDEYIAGLVKVAREELEKLGE